SAGEISLLQGHSVTHRSAASPYSCLSLKPLRPNVGYAEGVTSSDFICLVRGCTFDDFLFAPQYSVLERRDPSVIDLTARFSEHIQIRRPIVSANMDTI